ncbi:MAG: CRISPR-associated endonuclease Cas2 [Treponema sp.]|nr:CRISPR-associated endonuclease Cas2 [Treponema sp.]
MAEADARIMYLFVFFDLPTRTFEEKKGYMKFRKFLKEDGYNMLQYSIYTRVCRGMESVKAHRAKLKAHLPEAGCIRLLLLTEKQYGAIEILLGKKRVSEKYEQLSLLTF